MPRRYGHPGRPSEFNRFLELSKIAWAPVLELLGREVRFTEFDARPYEFKPALGIDKVIMKYEIDEGAKREDFRWLQAEEILHIHDDMIRVFGGEAGVLDSGKIASALGIASAFIFLGMNDYLMWSRDVLDEVDFAIHVAKGEIETDRIADWLADRVIPRNFVSKFKVSNLLRVAQRKGRQCSVCGRFLRITAHEVTCTKCHTSYKVVINSGLIQKVGTNKNGTPKEQLVLDFGMRMVAKV